MAPAKPTIESREKNRRALHSTYDNWINDFQKKVHQLPIPRSMEALLVFLPPKTSSMDFIANRNRSLNPARRPDPNQEQRRISITEELVDLAKVLQKVRERIRFLQSESKQNVENSSHQGGDLTSSTSTVVDDAATAADQC